MAWCEANRVDYVFGLARNERLVEEIAAELIAADERSQPHRQAGAPLQGLHAGRRWTAGAASAASSARPSGPTARPIRASSSPRSSAARSTARHLYEEIYCARGEMENRIKECQLDLFADRTSAATMRANQLRLWFASMAYVLLCALRRIGLAHTQFAEATCGTIRLKLLKIGALVRISVRRIKVAMASACPWQDEFALAHAPAAHAPPPDTNQTAHSRPYTSQQRCRTGGDGAARRWPSHHHRSPRPFSQLEPVSPRHAPLGGKVEERRGAAMSDPFPLPAHQTGRADFPHPAFRLASPRHCRRRANVQPAKPEHAKVPEYLVV